MDTIAPEGTIAAVIARVSDPRRSRGTPVDDQTRENLAACDRHRWIVPGDAVFTEKQSASRFATRARKEWERLTAGVRAGRYGVVVMWEPSRADRTPDTWFPFLTACRQTRTLIYVTPQDRLYDMNDWRDYRAMAEEGVDAAIEVEKLSQRTRRGVRSNVAAGRPHGRILYGYERVYDDRTRALIVQRAHPQRAPFVLEIKMRIAAGDPVSVITADLNARGIPAPAGGTWHRETVRDIAMNPAYIAKRYWRGDEQLHEGKWESLVPEEIHYAAVLVLSDPARVKTRPGRHVYMLSHLATCGECGAPLEGHPPWVRQQALPGYRCVRGCTATRVPWLDTFISRLAVRKLSEPGTYETVTAPRTEDHSAARAEADALRNRLREASESYARGRIAIEDLEAVRARLQPEVDRAERRLSEVSVPPPLRALLTDPLEDMTARWEAMGVAARKEAVRYLFAYIRLKRAARRGNTRGFDASRVEWDWSEALR